MSMPDPSRTRDYRIDFLRGLALIMIFINHIPDTALGAYTSRNFGFSDAAEAFVLLSGISAGLAYSPLRRKRSEDGSIFGPWSRAFTLWWVQALVVLCIYLMIAATLNLPGVAEMAAERNVAPVLDDPAGLLAPLLILTHQFNCADILPLYILLLLAAPGLIAVGWRWPLLLLVGSGLLWAYVGWYAVNLRTWPTDHEWFFNPLSWQFLFVVGLLIGLAKSRNQQWLPIRAWVAVPAVICLVASAAWMQVPSIADRGYEILAQWQERIGAPQVVISFDKTYLAPLRVLHIFVLAYALAAWPLLHKIAQSRHVAAIVVLGRNALPAFATGSILGYLIQIIRISYLTTPPVDILLIGVGMNIMLLVALLNDRRKRRGRPLVPSHAGH